MIAADTSTWIAFFQGAAGDDTQLLRRALEDKQVVMVHVVLAELLSDPNLPPELATELLAVPLVQLEPGYWQRAGMLRAKMLAKARRARLGDALITQSCIDAEIPLLTRDGDFRAFSVATSLHLLSGGN